MGTTVGLWGKPELSSSSVDLAHTTKLPSPCSYGIAAKVPAPEGGKQKEKLSVWQLFTGEPIEEVLSRCEMCL